MTSESTNSAHRNKTTTTTPLVRDVDDTGVCSEQMMSELAEFFPEDEDEEPITRDNAIKLLEPKCDRCAVFRSNCEEALKALVDLSNENSKLEKHKMECESLKKQIAASQILIDENMYRENLLKARVATAEKEAVEAKTRYEALEKQFDAMARAVEEGQKHAQAANEWRVKYELSVEISEKIQQKRREDKEKFDTLIFLVGYHRRDVEHTKRENKELKAKLTRLKFKLRKLVNAMHSYVPPVFKVLKETMASPFFKDAMPESVQAETARLCSVDVQNAFLLDDTTTAFTSDTDEDDEDMATELERSLARKPMTTLFEKSGSENAVFFSKNSSVHASPEVEHKNISQISDAEADSILELGAEAATMPSSKQIVKGGSGRRVSARKGQGNVTLRSEANPDLVEVNTRYDGHSRTLIVENVSKASDMDINEILASKLKRKRDGLGSANDTFSSAKHLSIHGRKMLSVCEQQKAQMNISIKEKVALMKKKEEEEAKKIHTIDKGVVDATEGNVRSGDALLHYEADKIHTLDKGIDDTTEGNVRCGDAVLQDEADKIHTLDKGVVDATEGNVRSGDALLHYEADKIHTLDKGIDDTTEGNVRCGDAVLQDEADKIHTLDKSVDDATEGNVRSGDALLPDMTVLSEKTSESEFSLRDDLMMSASPSPVSSVIEGETGDANKEDVTLHLLGITPTVPFVEHEEESVVQCRNSEAASVGEAVSSSPSNTPGVIKKSIDSQAQCMPVITESLAVPEAPIMTPCAKEDASWGADSAAISQVSDRSLRNELVENEEVALVICETSCTQEMQNSLDSFKESYNTLQAEMLSMCAANSSSAVHGVAPSPSKEALFDNTEPALGVDLRLQVDLGIKSTPLSKGCDMQEVVSENSAGVTLASAQRMEVWDTPVCAPKHLADSKTRFSATTNVTTNSTTHCQSKCHVSTKKSADVEPIKNDGNASLRYIHDTETKRASLDDQKVKEKVIDAEREHVLGNKCTVESETPTKTLKSHKFGCEARATGFRQRAARSKVQAVETREDSLDNGPPPRKISRTGPVAPKRRTKDDSTTKKPILTPNQLMSDSSDEDRLYMADDAECDEEQSSLQVSSVEDECDPSVSEEQMDVGNKTLGGRVFLAHNTSQRMIRDDDCESKRSPHEGRRLRRSRESAGALEVEGRSTPNMKAGPSAMQKFNAAVKKQPSKGVATTARKFKTVSKQGHLSAEVPQMSSQASRLNTSSDEPTKHAGKIIKVSSQLSSNKTIPNIVKKTISCNTEGTLTSKRSVETTLQKQLHGALMSDQRLEMIRKSLGPNLEAISKMPPMDFATTMIKCSLHLLSGDMWTIVQRNYHNCDSTNIHNIKENTFLQVARELAGNDEIWVIYVKKMVRIISTETPSSIHTGRLVRLLTGVHRLAGDLFSVEEKKEHLRLALTNLFLKDMEIAIRATTFVLLSPNYDLLDWMKDKKNPFFPLVSLAVTAFQVVGKVMLWAYFQQFSEELPLQDISPASVQKYFKDLVVQLDDKAQQRSRLSEQDAATLADEEDTIIRMAIAYVSPVKVARVNLVLLIEPILNDAMQRLQAALNPRASQGERAWSEAYSINNRLRLCIGSIMHALASTDDHLVTQELCAFLRREIPRIREIRAEIATLAGCRRPWIEVYRKVIDSIVEVVQVLSQYEI